MGKEKNGTLVSIVKNEFKELVALRPRDYASPYPVVAGNHELKVPDLRAAFAMQCIERWAMVAGQPDGEDSAGRAKLRRLTANEVAAHACDCTEKAFAEFQNRGWLLEVPLLNALLDQIKDAENTNS